MEETEEKEEGNNRSFNKITNWGPLLKIVRPNKRARELFIN